jgi:RES domain
VLLYRVFPSLETAPAGDPGHPLYVEAAAQGRGRWDNPNLYTTMYLSPSPEAAVGETFGNLVRWTPKMFQFPALPGSVKALATFQFDEEAHPLLDLDDAGVLSQLGIRPTHVVIRNRPRTQQIAAGIFGEGPWSGIQWWSYHRPQWTAVALWDIAGLTVVEVEDISTHPALAAAATTLSKPTRGF